MFNRSKEENLPDELHLTVKSVIANQYVDPYLSIDLISANAVKNISRENSALKVTVVLNYPAKLNQHKIQNALTSGLKTLLTTDERFQQFNDVQVHVGWQIPAHQGQRQEVSRIKNIIAVSSGKGGVGKSTTSVNLALALQIQGAKVGLLDADLFGPSQPLLLGIPEGVTPQTRDMRYYAPITAHGLELMSMGVMVTEKTPLMWRGPVASETIKQLINQTLWGDLDYLLIDMPPGTGDIQISVAQTLAIAGAVIVTTPQDMALLDAKKGIEMFEKVDIPTLGIIENMSTHICSKCGQAESIFGKEGGDKLSREYCTELLGSLPLTMKIRQQADAGLPIVLADPESKTAQIYHDIALKMAVNVAQPGFITPLPKISFVND
ncbi:iron-sulfur cluster carrier protein ApbC [Litoribacillus peritrichatus]